MKTTIAAILLLGACVAIAQPPESPVLFRTALSRAQIVFHYGGDLWIVGREGGAARRLTTNPGQTREREK